MVSSYIEMSESAKTSKQPTPATAALVAIDIATLRAALLNAGLVLCAHPRFRWSVRPPC
jgi:hypothetical protein